MRVMLVINHISECFDWKQLELQYQHEYNNISNSIGLTENPMVNFSGVVGTPLLALGTDLSYDIASGSLFSFVDVCFFFNASYCHVESPLTYTDVGAKLAHSFSTNENTLTIGTQKALDQLTSIKARINNHGKASALIQHEWRPRYDYRCSWVNRLLPVALALVFLTSQIISDLPIQAFQ
ncbi:mitochondrial outer membrane protein porin of 34 kDa-like [Papaver somniferum]|uniref:mitochondrial outer membrane protein porin of 34 kDa-like n=1 Tax=Papaver somniferum TaxID=3469 RepID=UPI000E7049AB|nr:mitochondrial outer membrane protein porin of 34 kDa-like [Papaver somniferum]